MADFIYCAINLPLYSLQVKKQVASPSNVDSLILNPIFRLFGFPTQARKSKSES